MTNQQTITVKMADATNPQVREFAQRLGLEVGHNERIESIKAKISTVYQGETITIAAPTPKQEAGTPPQKPAAYVRAAGEEVIDVVRQQGGLGREDPRAIISISSQERHGMLEKTDVNVGVNGVVWQLKREVRLEIPYRVLEALENAKVTTIDMDPMTGDETFGESYAYPFMVHKRPSDEEVEAWRANTSEAFAPA